MAYKDDKIVHGPLRNINHTDDGKIEVTRILPESNTDDVILTPDNDSHVMSLIEGNNPENDRATLRDVLRKLSKFAFKEKLEESDLEGLLPEDTQVVSSDTNSPSTTDLASSRAVYDAKRNAVNLNDGKPNEKGATKIYAPSDKGEGIPYYNKDNNKWEWGKVTSEDIDNWNRILENTKENEIDSLNFSEIVSGESVKFYDVKYIEKNTYILLGVKEFYIYNSSTGNIESYQFKEAGSSWNVDGGGSLLVSDDYIYNKKCIYAIINNKKSVYSIDPDTYESVLVFDIDRDRTKYSLGDITGLSKLFPSYTTNGDLTIIGFTGSVNTAGKHYYINISNIINQKSDIVYAGTTNYTIRDILYDVSYDQSTNRVNNLIYAIGSSSSSDSIFRLNYSGSNVIENLMTLPLIPEKDTIRVIKEQPKVLDSDGYYVSFSCICIDSSNHIVELMVRSSNITGKNNIVPTKVSLGVIGVAYYAEYRKITEFTYVTDGSTRRLFSDRNCVLGDIENITGGSSIGLDKSAEYNIFQLNGVVYRFTKSNPYEMYMCDINGNEIINEPCDLYFNSTDSINYFSNKNNGVWTSNNPPISPFFYVNDTLFTSVPFSKKYNNSYTETIYASKLQSILTFDDIIQYVSREQRTLYNQNIVPLEKEIEALKNSQHFDLNTIVIGIEGEHEENACDYIVSTTMTFDNILDEVSKKIESDESYNCIHILSGQYSLYKTHTFKIQNNFVFEGDDGVFSADTTYIDIYAPGKGKLSFNGVHGDQRDQLTIRDVIIRNPDFQYKIESGAYDGESLVLGVSNIDTVSMKSVTFNLEFEPKNTNVRNELKVNKRVSYISLDVTNTISCGVNLDNINIDVLDHLTYNSDIFSITKDVIISVNNPIFNIRGYRGAFFNDDDNTTQYELIVFGRKVIGSGVNQYVYWESPNDLIINGGSIILQGRSTYTIDSIKTKDIYQMTSLSRSFNDYSIVGTEISLITGGSISTATWRGCHSVMRNVFIRYGFSDIDTYLDASLIEGTTIVRPQISPGFYNDTSLSAIAKDLHIQKNTTIIGSYIDAYHINIPSTVKITGTFIRRSTIYNDYVTNNSDEQTTGKSFTVTGEGYHKKDTGTYGLVSARASDQEKIQPTIHISEGDPGTVMKPGDLWFKLPDTE